MQEVYEDGTLGEIKTADTLEDLLPMIKESLADPKVKYVKVFNNGQKVQAEQERKTQKDELLNLMESTADTEDEVQKKKAATMTFPSKRR